VHFGVFEGLTANKATNLVADNLNLNGHRMYMLSPLLTV
jgi:hypothetical protein